MQHLLLIVETHKGVDVTRYEIDQMNLAFAAFTEAMETAIFAELQWHG